MLSMSTARSTSLVLNLICLAFSINHLVFATISLDDLYSMMFLSYCWSIYLLSLYEGAPILLIVCLIIFPILRVFINGLKLGARALLMIITFLIFGLITSLLFNINFHFLLHFSEGFLWRCYFNYTTLLKVLHYPNVSQYINWNILLENRHSLISYPNKFIKLRHISLI